MNTPKPMDPERLTLARDYSVAARGVSVPGGVSGMRMLLSELLADHDYHALRADAAERERDEARQLADDATALLAADVRRLRARVRVEAEDVERAGVTRAHVEAWLCAKGWDPDLRDDGFDYSIWRLPENPRAPVVVFDQLSPGWTADVVRVLAVHVNRPGLDILDEMAAMEVGS